MQLMSVSYQYSSENKVILKICSIMKHISSIMRSPSSESNNQSAVKSFALYGTECSVSFTLEPATELWSDTVLF